MKLNKFFRVLNLLKIKSKKQDKSTNIKMFELKDDYDESNNIFCNIIFKQDDKVISVIENINPLLFNKIYFMLNKNFSCNQYEMDDYTNKFEFDIESDKMDFVVNNLVNILDELKGEI